MKAPPKTTPATPVTLPDLAGKVFLVTGGSDCHGMAKGKPLIGTIKLPYEHVEKLIAAKKSREETTNPK